MLVPDINSGVSYVNWETAVVQRCNVEIGVLKMFENFHKIIRDRFQC